MTTGTKDGQAFQVDGICTVCLKLQSHRLLLLHLTGGQLARGLEMRSWNFREGTEAGRLICNMDQQLAIASRYRLSITRKLTKTQDWGDRFFPYVEISPRMMNFNRPASLLQQSSVASSQCSLNNQLHRHMIIAITRKLVKPAIKSFNLGDDRTVQASIGLVSA